MAYAVRKASQLYLGLRLAFLKMGLARPITACAWCGAVRITSNYWKKVTCSSSCCSHSACPECYKTAVSEFREELCQMR